MEFNELVAQVAERLNQPVHVVTMFLRRTVELRRSVATYAVEAGDREETLKITNSATGSAWIIGLESCAAKRMEDGVFVPYVAKSLRLFERVHAPRSSDPSVASHPRGDFGGRLTDLDGYDRRG